MAVAYEICMVPFLKLSFRLNSRGKQHRGHDEIKTFQGQHWNFFPKSGTCFETKIRMKSSGCRRSFDYLIGVFETWFFLIRIFCLEKSVERIKTHPMSHVNLGTPSDFCSAHFQPKTCVCFTPFSQGVIDLWPKMRLWKTQISIHHALEEKRSVWSWQMFFFVARDITNTPFEIMIYTLYIYTYMYVFILAFDL